MALSASLLLRQNQSLVMTPQLMQSIQLLQMTHFELTQFIAQEVERNPLLEIAANDSDLGADSPADAENFGDTDGEGPDRAAAVTADSDDWYGDRAANLGEQLDTSFENVFPDDAEPRKADAPNWQASGNPCPDRSPVKAMISMISSPQNRALATISISNCHWPFHPPKTE